MSILSRILLGSTGGSGAPSRDSWPHISLQIAKQLAEAQEAMFLHSVQLLEEMSARYPNCKPQNESISEHIKTIFAAFGLYWTGFFIFKHKYLAEKDKQDFMDLLRAQLCGSRLDECMEYLDTGRLSEDSTIEMVTRFCGDVGSAITESSPDLGIAGLLAPSAFTLVILTHMICARAFGDAQTAKQLEAQLEEEISSA